MTLSTLAQTGDDPWLWLEDVGGDAALAWVRERNAESQAELGTRPEYAALKPRLRAALDASDRIPAISRAGAFVYNFWQDGANKRGLWRRTTLAEYRKDAPAWQVLLDLDALATAEGENWVWKGASCLAPDYRRCLMHLSRGGADAAVVREYDLQTRAFVKDGFTLPEAKSDVVWEDLDHVLVGTDFGPGSLTDSGYPRVIKRWTRGTPLAQARTVYEGRSTDVSAWVSVERAPGVQRVLVGRSPDFYSNEVFLLQGEQISPVPKPIDAELSFRREWALLQLRSDLDLGGKHHPRGSLLAAAAADVLTGQARWQAVFTPTATRSLDHAVWTRHHLVLNLLDQVANRVEALTWQPAMAPAAASEASGSRLLAEVQPVAASAAAPSVASSGAASFGAATPAAASSVAASASGPTRPVGVDGHWQRADVALPGPGTLSLAALNDAWLADDELADHLLVNYVDFTTPDTLYLTRAEGGVPERLKQRKPQFDASGMQVEQRFASSADGTRVPYFVVWPRGAALSASVPGGPPRPTLLYGYGGFEISMQPWYSAAWGMSWYERGGVLVVANIRGGGEFGPAWHQAAIKANKQRSYDDFIAVAEDLIRSGITDAAHLGIMGGSNGGLLVGAAFTQRPELFKAVVCQVPLLDMRRFHKLLAGASWMAEYGDPDDPAQWAWISQYSPYQNLHAERSYPRVLFATSTRDDRVHPGHARKMVARLRELGKPVLYYENIEGGHGGAADNEQRAHLLALEFAYLWAELGASAAR